MSGVRVKCGAAWGLPHPVPGLGAAVACQVGAGGMGSWTKATKLKGHEILHLGRNRGPLLLVPGHGMLQFFIGVPFLDNSSVAGSGAAPQEEPCPWAARRLKLMLLMEVQPVPLPLALVRPDVGYYHPISTPTCKNIIDNLEEAE